MAGSRDLEGLPRLKAAYFDNDSLLIVLDLEASSAGPVILAGVLNRERPVLNSLTRCAPNFLFQFRAIGQLGLRGKLLLLVLDEKL